MSDVYAMGGEVLFALQIAAWPEDAPISQLERIFAGAVDTVREAGGVVAGGHTVIDREPKFGLAVTGRVDPRRILRKDALRAGDSLWLTKPIGTGVLTTAHKRGELSPEDLASTIASMVALNREAARAAVQTGVHAATDITGFGLAGHLHEMAVAAGVEVRIKMSAVPLLPGARAHALGGSFGGLERNQAHFLSEGRVRLELADESLRVLALDPQTSGGLVVGVPAAHAAEWERAMRMHNITAARIGDVVAGSGVTIAA
jgi:selenide, water dikinase